jgi:hypothetical protein
VVRLGGEGGKYEEAEGEMQGGREGNGVCVPDRQLSSMGNGRKKQKRRILRRNDRAGQDRREC